MKNEVVMDEPIPFLKPNKSFDEKWDDMDHLILQTKQCLSDAGLLKIVET